MKERLAINLGDTVFIKPNKIYHKWVIKLYNMPFKVAKIINERYVYLDMEHSLSWHFEELIIDNEYRIKYDIFGSII
jgi:hypothetical protein